MLFSLVGCTDISGLEEDIFNLTNRVENLENAVSALRSALDSGKLVKSVEADDEGWTVTFSDNSAIYIVSREGLKTAVPRVSIDEAGYWTVSYDGENYQNLLDGEGNKVKAIGVDGDSVRVIVTDDGYYAFELYSGVSSGTPLEVIRTPYSADPSTVITSIVKDEEQDLMIISMGDGSTFVFKIDPSQSVNSVCDISSVKLLLNDNKEYLLKDVAATITGSKIDIFIPYVCDVSNIKPEITLTNSEASVVENVSEGLDLTKYQEITVEHPNGASKKYMIRTRVFTGLPIVTIETENRYVSPDKSVYVNGNFSISKTNEFPEGFSAPTQLKGRGNATWSYPKKPYRIKLNKKASIFGIDADKSWVLLAGYCDKTLLRASVQFKLSEILKMDWTPKWQYVELFLNGQYEGNYLFTEHIKTSKSRVKVEDDGYLFQMDNYAKDEPVYFTSDMGFEFSFKTPDPDDGITDEQVNYAKSYINKLEKALIAPDVTEPDAEFLKMIDVESWIKWYLVNTLIANLDTNDYFVIPTAGAKLKKGPVWDAEWSCGIGWDQLKPVEYDFNMAESYAYYPKMLLNPYFKSELRRIFMENKDALREGLADYVNEMYEYLYVSQQFNFAKWPVMNDVISVNYTSNGTWENEVLFLKTYFLKRLTWMESFLNNL
ncbi:MAG: CotH kinase family protein [Muribaculaceae bacterium]|nr:CotH kinase family protein [Muribaculaceae bacterium]